MSTTKRRHNVIIDGNEGYFHRNYDDFTKSLRSLMKDNPSLPVVPLVSISGSKDIKAAVGYVHDKKTEFVEKCIVITDGVPELSGFSLLCLDDELPFH